MATATAKQPAPAAPAARGKLFPTRHDLPDDTRRQLVALLNAQLADYLDLYSQVKHAHWNVKGPDFIGMHKLLDELAERLEESIDEVAERATALGGVADGTVRFVAGSTRLPEFPADTHHAHLVAAALADRYAHAGKSTRAAVDAAGDLGDKDTADLLTNVSRLLDKSMWLLEAHVQVERDNG